MTETFYDVLGVAPDATTEEIRSAYRERIKESHPDRNDDEDASETTRRIIRARDVLVDEKKRRLYDRIGHDAFVGQSNALVDEDDVSDAAAAARRAGWAAEDGAPGSSSDPTGTTHANARRRARARARARRRRERAARERVEETTSGTNSEDDRASATSTGGGETAEKSGFERDAGPTRSRNQKGGYNVRQHHRTTSGRSRAFPPGESLTLVGITFVLYPVLLFSAVFPPFPLVVNLVVGLCTILLVGYLQSVPGVGVVVFGVWSLATPLAFAIAGVSLTSLVGVVALTATWLPLGLSLLSFTLIRD